MTAGAHAATTGPTAVLARFAAGLTLEAIPAPTREQVKLLLLDALASALGGHREEQGERVLAAARALMGPGDSTVIGGAPLSAAGATLANGYLVTGATLCDIYYPSSTHCSPEVVPPALAAAGLRDASGRALLVALAAGYEVTTRIGRGLHFAAFQARGWHSPGIIGQLGGAVGAGLLLGLDADGLVQALGIAGSEAAGVDAQHGTPTIKFHQAHGALAALVAAQLAATGFTALGEILTHPTGGIYATHSDGGDPAYAVAGLGSEWELHQISLRPWPLATLLQNVAGIVVELARAEDLRAEDVARLRLTLSPAAVAAGQGQLDSFVGAQTSARWLATVALHDRYCWVDQLTPDGLADEARRGFALDRVELVADPTLGRRAARVEAVLRDGRSVTRERACPRGEPADPLTRDEVVEKFRRAAVPVIGATQADTVVAAVTALEGEASVRPLLAALGRGTAG